MRRVAVIDDNALMRLLASDALQASGYDVVTFESAIEALASSAREVPGLYLVDQEMPGMTGAAFVRAVRGARDLRLRATPIVGLTGGCDAELLEAGADACVKKPFSEAALVEAADRAMHREAGAASLDAVIAKFGGLHDEALARALDVSEAREYARLRGEFVRALLAMQDAFSRSPPPRGTLRLNEPLPLELTLRRERIAATTLDVGTGGFSARLEAEVPAGEQVEFVLHLPGEQVAGAARATNVGAAREAGGARVGFAFVELPSARAERLETFVLTRILARLRRPAG